MLFKSCLGYFIIQIFLSFLFFYLNMEFNEYMAAFQERIDEKDYLVVYVYDSKDDFVKDVNNHRFDGMKVIRSEIKYREIHDVRLKRDLSLRFVGCRD